MSNRNLELQKECEEKAFRIVERLLEENIDPEWFLNSLVFLQPSHFQDVVDERSITHTCGYPLCDNELADIPNKQFHISTQMNKVFDITERKKFCSNKCFESCQHIVKQIPSTPLWMRKTKERQEFHLLQSTTQRSSGFGVEIELRNKLLEDSSAIEEESSTVEADHESVLDEVICDGTDVIHEDEPGLTEDVSIQEQTNEIFRGRFVANKQSHRDDLSTDKDRTEVAEVKKIPEIMENKKKHVSTESPRNPVNLVEQVLRDWFTVETFRLLLGDCKLKEALSVMGDTLEEEERSCGCGRTKAEVVHKEQYLALCRKLEMLQVKSENLMDMEVTVKDPKTELKPLPSYDALQEEMKNQQEQVTSFLHGKSVTVGKENVKLQVKEKSELPLPVLPMVDSHSQKALRRRIVLEKINKTLPPILQAVGLQSGDISGNLRELISTFNLTSCNITFQPTEWMLVSMAVLHQLSVRDPRIRDVLNNAAGRKVLSMMLLTYNLDPGYLNRLTHWLLDLRYIMEDIT